MRARKVGGKQIYNGLLTPENPKRNKKESFLLIVKYEGFIPFLSKALSFILPLIRKNPGSWLIISIKIEPKS